MSITGSVTQHDIGHVAPDFATPRRHFNTLRIAPQYRISIEMGSIESLFAQPAASDPGMMARLQVLGLFYFPLDHPRAAAAYAAGWAWFRDQILGPGTTDDQARAAVQDALIRRVVSGVQPPPFRVPPAGGSPAEAWLPAAPAPGSTTHENFGKIRIPGGYTFITSPWNRGLNNHPDPHHRYNRLFEIYHDLRQAEQAYYDANPVLGKIPLVARVQKRRSPGQPWEAAADATVYFQLVAPTPLPAWDAGLPSNGQANRPPLDQGTIGPPPHTGGNGPDRFTSAEEARHEDRSDPQWPNAHNDRGGLRGQPVPGHAFATRSVPRFNVPDGGPFPLAESASGQPHAVRARTNAEGKAGVLFTPSRCGGDAYRIRAYIGPPTMQSDGADPEAVRVDTGTLVVWRNMRISRYIRQSLTVSDGSPGLAQVLLDQAQATTPPWRNDANQYLWRLGAAHFEAEFHPLDHALPRLDLRPTRAAGGFYGVADQFARAFCEVEVDRPSDAADPHPEEMSQPDWDAARAAAIDDATFAMNRGPKRFDLRRLVFAGDARVTVSNAGCFIPMMTPDAYNAAVGAHSTLAVRHAADRERVHRLVEDIMYSGFVRYFSKDGFLPGLTIVQAAGPSTWQVLGCYTGGLSGLALKFRGAVVTDGRDRYPTRINEAPQNSFHLLQSYSFTSNTCHEIGHCLYRDHAPGHDPGRSDAGMDPGASREHDDQHVAICLMSYKTSEGRFCARCLFAFRGWDARRQRR